MRMKWTGLVAAAALLFTMAGCSKQPFQAVEPKPGKSVVYVYWPEAYGVDAVKYDVVINGEIVGIVHNNSYIARDVPNGPLNVTVQNNDPVAAHLETSTVSIDTSGDNVAYVKVTSPFKVSVPDEEVAREEIKKTLVWDGLIGSELQATATAEKRPVSQESSFSAAAEIERLVALKEKGAITEEEYEILKARIIAK